MYHVQTRRLYRLLSLACHGAFLAVYSLIQFSDLAGNSHKSKQLQYLIIYNRTMQENKQKKWPKHSIASRHRTGIIFRQLQCHTQTGCLGVTLSRDETVIRISYSNSSIFNCKTPNSLPTEFYSHHACSCKRKKTESIPKEHS